MAASSQDTVKEPSRTHRWTERLLVAVTPAGQAATRSQDLRSSMYGVLRLGTAPQTWQQAVTSLARQYERSHQECSRMLILAETSGWLSVWPDHRKAPLPLRDFLLHNGLLSEARTEALARRLPAGPQIDVPTLIWDVANIGWLPRAEAGFVARIGRQTVWHWE